MDGWMDGQAGGEGAGGRKGCDQIICWTLLFLEPNVQ